MQTLIESHDHPQENFEHREGCTSRIKQHIIRSIMQLYREKYWAICIQNNKSENIKNSSRLVEKRSFKLLEEH